MALNLNEADPVVHNNLAWLYALAKDEKVQDKAKALEHAKRAAGLSKEGNAEILDTLATAYFLNGHLKEAGESEKRALKLEPENKSYQEHLARYEKALQEEEASKRSK